MQSVDGGFERGVEALTRALAGARHAVVLTGAGISTESGIPDFRSPGTGLWERLDPMEVLSARAFWQDPAAFYRVAARTWLPPLLEAIPNAAHQALAWLESAGIVRCVITQNIDGLHHKAGSRRVLEIHGHVRWARCTRCGRHHDLPAVLQRTLGSGAGPYCTCGGAIKPAVVLFGDPMPPVFEQALAEATRCDLMVVVGSSLTVDPANLLPTLARRLAINNLQPTPLDSRAMVCLPYPAGQVWSEVARRFASSQWP